MAKRILDGEAMWSSRKIALLPEAYRAEYAWLHSLAAANGVFERDDRVIWAKCYAITRPNKTLDDVTAILNAFIAVKLLFPWSAEEKEWLYWTNSDRPGLLPRKSWLERERKNGRLPPDPPQDTLQTFLHESARQELAANTAEACRSVPGSGLGLGVGSGSGKGDAQAQAPSRFVFQGSHVKITERQDKLLGDAFPWVDRTHEYHKIDSWLEGNPDRRPKKANRFVHNWFTKILLPQSHQGAKNRAEQRTTRNLEALGLIKG